MKIVIAMFTLMLSSNITLDKVNATNLSGKCQKHTFGYWENWRGPINPGPGTINDSTHYENDFAPMSHIIYSSLTLAQVPNNENPPKEYWDGLAIYESVTRANVMEVLPGPNSNSLLNWQTTKLEAMMKHAKDTGKKWIWAIGGWSDLTKTIRPTQVDAFVEKCVELLKHSGDGIDFHWEHISEDASLKQQQLQTMALMFNNLRERLNKEGLKDAVIGYTTRFNAFTDNFNRQNGQMAFLTDGEGMVINNALLKIKTKLKHVVNFVNIMMYDVPPSQLGAPNGFTLETYKNIFNSFNKYFFKNQIVMGFEPGSQAAGGQWEGLKVDKEVTDYIQSEGYGGVMYWAINETGTNSPPTGKNVNTLAKYAQKQFKCLASTSTPSDMEKKKADQVQKMAEEKKKQAEERKQKMAEMEKEKAREEMKKQADLIKKMAEEKKKEEEKKKKAKEAKRILAKKNKKSKAKKTTNPVEQALPQIHVIGKYCPYWLKNNKQDTMQECVDSVAQDQSNPKYFSYASLNKDCLICKEPFINSLAPWAQANIYKRH